MKNNSTLVKVLNLFTKSKWLMSLIISLTIVQVYLTIRMPLLIGRLVDVIISENQVDFASVKQLLIEMGIVVISNTIVQAIIPVANNRMVYQVMSQLRQNVMEKLHQLAFKRLDKLSVGDVVSRLVSDIDQMSDAILMVFNQFFMGILTIIATIYTMFQLDKQMLLIVLVLTPLSLIVARFIAKNSYRYFQWQTRSRGDYTQFVEEQVQQMETVRNFNAQSSSIATFNHVNQQYAKFSLQAIFYSSLTNPATRFINAIIYALLTLVGAQRIIAGVMKVGELTTFLNYVVQYTKPFNDISSVFSEIQGALACATRVFELLELPIEQEKVVTQQSPVELKGAVTFEHIDFSYTPQQTLITDLNLDIKVGQKVAIVGPTGAGKSTLINLLMRFYEVNSGQIKIDNMPITQLSKTDLRQQIGMVLQETWLKAGTIHENIAYANQGATREQVIEAAKAAHADYFIKQLPQGYDTVIDQDGSSLSIGQQQLIAIARLFVKIPTILILDEATSSIDTRIELLIQKAFEKLMQNRTTFIIAHRLSTIQTADLILVMNQGNIVEQGNHQQLMKQKGLYYQMQQARLAVES